MGMKVNIFLAFLLASAYLLWNSNVAMLFLNLMGFTALYKNFKVWKFTSKFPGRNFSINWKTFFGNTAENFHRELDELWVSLGRDKFITWIGFERFLSVSRLNDVKAALRVTDDSDFMDHHQQMWPWLGGDGVIKSSGNSWLITSSHGDKLLNHVSVLSHISSDFSPKGLLDALIDGQFYELTQSDAFVVTLNKRIEVMCQQSFTRDDVIDVQPMIRLMTFDVVYELAMGRELQSQRRELFEAAEKLCQLSDQRVYSGWKQNKWLLNVLGEELKVESCQNVLTQCVKKVLNEKRAERARETSCLMDVLVASEELDENTIASTLVAFIVLGYDRLSSATTFALMELSKQSEAQETIYRQAKVNSSEMLDNLVLETQRLYPSTSVIIKWITEGVPLNGYFIPPNSSLLIYLNGTGRDANRFENPDKFDLSRKNLQIDIFGGIRSEISLPTTLMKVVLGNVVKKYQLRMDKESDIRIGSGITMRTNGLRLNVRSR